MKNIIKVLLFGSAFFVACQKNTKQMVTTNTTAITAYSEAVTELANDHTAYLERLENSLKTIKIDLQRPAESKAFEEVKPIFSTPNLIKAAANPHNPPLALEIRDRMFFKNSIALLNKDFELINEVYTALTDYITTSEFKNDEGEKGNQLVDSLTKLRSEYLAKQALILKKLAELNKAMKLDAKTKPVQATFFPKRAKIIVDATVQAKVIADELTLKGDTKSVQPIYGYDKMGDSSKKIKETAKELVMLAEQETKLREAFRNFAD